MTPDPQAQRTPYKTPDLRALGSLVSLTLGMGGSYPDGASGTAREHVDGNSDRQDNGRANGHASGG